MPDPDFTAALAAASIEMDDELSDRLEAYVRVMWEMNESLNLTRHTTWDLFVSRDLRDCLQLAHLLQPNEEILDLGSGNGIPGIVLAILRPDIEVSLAESVGKRAAALTEIVSQLELPVAVYASRGEDLLDDFRFTSVVSRAVGSIAKFCRWIQPHWSGVDRLLLVKGPRWVAERGEARHLGLMANLELRKLASYPLGIVAPSGPEHRSAAGEPVEGNSEGKAATGTQDSGLADGSDDPDASDAPDGDPATGVILEIRHRRPT